MISFSHPKVDPDDDNDGILDEDDPDDDNDGVLDVDEDSVNGKATPSSVGNFRLIFQPFLQPCFR